MGSSIFAGVEVTPSVGEGANAPIGVTDACAEEPRKLIQVKINNLSNLYWHDGVSRVVARHVLAARHSLSRASIGKDAA